LKKKEEEEEGRRKKEGEERSFRTSTQPLQSCRRKEALQYKPIIICFMKILLMLATLMSCPELCQASPV
jgi:hypothetical protein